MRILDDTRMLSRVELHLTDDEAERLIESLVDCRDDLSSVGLAVSHAPVSDGDRDVVVYVYATPEELEAEVADRMSDKS